MTMNYHKTAQTILNLLKKQDIWFETFEHEPVRTSEEAAKIRHGYSLHQGAKALIIKVLTKTGESEFMMFVLPGDSRFSNKKVKQCLNAKDIRFATPKEISDLTEGIQIGGVPPFGNLFNLKVMVDPTLLENEKIIFNAGDRSFSIAIKSEDYKKLVQPTLIDIIV